MMVEPEQIQKPETLSLKEFIFPSEEIKKAVNDLELFHQLRNQDTIKLYQKWEGKENYSGDFYAYVKLCNMRELLGIEEGKAWGTIHRVIELIKEYKDEFSFGNFHLLSQTYQQEIIKIIVNGLKAYDLLSKWIEPINKKNILQAIEDASEVKIGNDKYNQFNILKFAEIKTKPHEEKGIGLFPDLLEIDNPHALVEYLRTENDLTDCMIVTFQKNEKYDFKTTINLFLVFNNTLYVIEMSERRLNLDNTAGARRPDRYLERFDNVWLPLDLMFSNAKKSSETQVMIRRQKVFKRGDMNEICKKSHAISAWIEIFMHRVIDYIKSSNKKIPIGVTTNDIIKALEDKSQPIEKRIKTNQYRSSFESQNDASSYLLEKYEKTLTNIIPVDSKLPAVLGTKKYVENVIKFKQRQELADQLQKQVYMDWKKNHRRVYTWIRKFVLSHKVADITKLALEDKKYPYMAYPQFTEKIKKPTITNEEILRTSSRKDFRINKFDVLEDLLYIIWTHTKTEIWRKDKVECEVCRKFLWTITISLEFRDYRQFCSFFNIKQNQIPVEMIQHFHEQNCTEVGNFILDDVDPVDLVKDFWFRDVYEKNITGFKATGNKWPNDEPYIKIYIPLCKRCFKNLGGKDE